MASDLEDNTPSDSIMLWDEFEDICRFWESMVGNEDADCGLSDDCGIFYSSKEELKFDIPEEDMDFRNCRKTLELVAREIVGEPEDYIGMAEEAFRKYAPDTEYTREDLDKLAREYASDYAYYLKNDTPVGRGYWRRRSDHVDDIEWSREDAEKARSVYVPRVEKYFFRSYSRDKAKENRKRGVGLE